MSRMRKMPIPEGISAEAFAALMADKGCEVKLKMDPKKGVMGLWVGTCTVKPKI